MTSANERLQREVSVCQERELKALQVNFFQAYIYGFLYVEGSTFGYLLHPQAQAQLNSKLSALTSSTTCGGPRRGFTISRQRPGEQKEDDDFRDAVSGWSMEDVEVEHTLVHSPPFR